LNIPTLCRLGGAIIVGEQTIVYHKGGSLKTIRIPQCGMKAYGRVDPDGSRWLLSDYLGRLFLLVLNHDKER
jgi:DNA damage-binding protein 1